MVNGWKIVGITFIILFVLETIFIGYVFYLGSEIAAKEDECVYNICSNYDSYYFDEYNDICYCYVNHEIVKTEYIP